MRDRGECVSGGIILVHEQRPPDVLDVRDLIAAAVDGFCENFGLAGVEERKHLLKRIAAEARVMAEEIG